MQITCSTEATQRRLLVARSTGEEQDRKQHLIQAWWTSHKYNYYNSVNIQKILKFKIGKGKQDVALSAEQLICLNKELGTINKHNQSSDKDTSGRLEKIEKKEYLFYKLFNG